MSDKGYRIVRYFFNGRRRVLAERVLLSEAQSHCNNPETSSRTATKYEAKKRTERYGPWFDGYEKR